MKIQRFVFDSICEGFTTHILHNDETEIAFFFEIDQPANVWMIELGQRFCFEYQALFCLHAWLQERSQELDGHFLIELCISGEINLTHASYTKLSLNCVAASEGPANHRVNR